MVTGLSQEPSSLLKTQNVVLSPPSPSNQKDIKKGLKDWKKRCHWIFYIISCVSPWFISLNLFRSHMYVCSNYRGRLPLLISALLMLLFPMQNTDLKFSPGLLSSLIYVFFSRSNFNYRFTALRCGAA